MLGVMSSHKNSPSRAERLPVNPRRHKVPAEARKRIAKACNGCNLRRAKCTGQTPCDRCHKAGRECIYPAAGETITIRRSEYEALLRTGTRRQSESSSGNDSRVYANSHVPQNGPSNLEHHNHETDATHDGAPLEDPQGTICYLGESSGATFLNHLRQFMATAFPIPGPALHSPETRFIAALGRYQTHDSRVLPPASDESSGVPTEDEAWRMVNELRRWTRDGPLTTASGGLYYWTDFDTLMTQYDQCLRSRTPENNRTLALLYAAFAVACQLGPDCSPVWECDGGQVFFSKARALLGNPLDTASLTDANILTLLGFYLLNSNRRDAAYMHVSIALHIYTVHGVHRGWLIDEGGKRAFWNAYVLDRWLSCLMGRPSVVNDEAINLDTPRDAPGLPPAYGLRAHIEIARITSYIAANVFGVSKHSAEPRSTALCIHKTLHMLKGWKQELPEVLQYDPSSVDQDMAAYDLQMACNHLKILAVRPWLFDSVKTHVTSMCLHGCRETDVLHREEIESAIDAARETIDLVRRLPSMKNQTHLVHTIIHHVFNAALALELHRTLSLSDLSSDHEDIAFVVTLLSAQQDGNRPFASDCAEVLSDLHSLIDKLCEGAKTSAGTTDFDHSTAMHHNWDTHGYHTMEVLGPPS